MLRCGCWARLAAHAAVLARFLASRVAAGVTRQRVQMYGSVGFSIRYGHFSSLQTEQVTRHVWGFW